MMESVKRGASRQELHEIIRVHSHAAARKGKMEGEGNDLIDRIAGDERIPMDRQEIEAQLDPAKYIGRCVSQVEEFLDREAAPVIERYHTEELTSSLKV